MSDKVFLFTIVDADDMLVVRGELIQTLHRYGFACVEASGGRAMFDAKPTLPGEPAEQFVLFQRLVAIAADELKVEVEARHCDDPGLGLTLPEDCAAIAAHFAAKEAV